jgi:SRSO17 transposase
MLPITSFLPCTESIDGLDCFSSRQKHHAKTYVTGLVAASNKTVEGISTHVLPARSERALNKFLTEYDWDEDQLNTERLDLLQQANDTRWSSDGVVIIDDTFTHKTGERIPNAGKFYDHTVPGYIFGQNLIYALYADEKTTYPLGFRLYEKDAKTRIELASDLVEDLIEIGVPADTYLFDMGYCSQAFVTLLESHGKEGSQLSKATPESRTAVNGSVSMRWPSPSTLCPEQSTAIPTTSGHRSAKSTNSVRSNS